MKFAQLTGQQRRRHMRFYRCVVNRGVVWARGECSFRIVERLHKAGLVTAYISKWNMFGRGSRTFRELEVRVDGSNLDLKPCLPRS